MLVLSGATANWHNTWQIGKRAKKKGRCNFGRFWRGFSSLELFEDEAGRLCVNQMSHFMVNINLARVEPPCSDPPQLLWGALEEMSGISLSGDRLEIKVLIIHSRLLPGNGPPLAELLCWLERSKDEMKMVEEEQEPQTPSKRDAANKIV